MCSAALLFLLPLILPAQVVISTGGGVTFASPLPATQPATTTPPEDLASVEGLVVNALTGEPVKKARIEIHPSEAGPSRDFIIYRTSTDGAGKFALNNIEPGSYQVSANRTGFVTIQYGARTPGRPGKPFSLNRAQKLREVNLRLTPQGVIAGRILDEDGEPLANVEVQLLRYRYLEGGRQLVGGAIAETNDLGEYRAFGVVPGKYYLSAEYPSYNNVEPARGPSANNQTEESYVKTYYPGTADSSVAVQLDLQPGAQLNNVSFSLSKTRSVHISGRVVNTSAKATGPVMVSLISRNATFGMRDSPRSMGPNSRFEIRGVLPGSYSLMAYTNQDGKTYSARQPVEVGSGNIENLTLTLGPGVAVSGHVRIDGDPNTPMKGVRFALRPRQNGLRFVPISNPTLKEDGTFLMEGVAPDEYNLFFSGLPEGFYVKSIRAGEAEVLTSSLDLTSGAPVALEITLSPNAGQITGVVQSGNTQQPAQGATVVLIPQEKERHDQQTYYKLGTTDQSGSFTLKGVPPGKYKAYAWEDVEPGAYLDPEFLKGFESKGEPVSVREGSHLNQQLTLVPAEGTAAAQ